MKTIDDYIDQAIENNGLKSDGDLCRHLSIARANVSLWRTKRSWPGDSMMVRLAESAGIDPADALLDLAAWRTDGEASIVWKQIAEKVSKTAAAGLLVAAISGAAGAEQPKNEVTSPPQPLYIMENWFQFLISDTYRPIRWFYIKIRAVRSWLLWSRHVQRPLPVPVTA